ncbi:hypothetical protein [Legionella bononiensis]|uniref:RasGEF domain protein n=1 Tax=Legionella bononiensis TaxID=2793102 RepID=A0ABS1WG53_9GAMM|nr:hypothetical protein [Legionella bononiensis]MBL7481783.1 hypothetical protein [Legionella bononiensis]MBL7528332.1 hypothetical protein [Legionella bononiensis]MBL7564295.1 hypothetical protein [Legionella bononiensis]
MKLTPRQKYQIILVVIEEAQRLAIKFGLNDGVSVLEEFKNSIQLSTGTKSLLELVILSEKDLVEKKKKSASAGQFKEAYKKNTANLIQILGSVFSNDPDVFHQTKELGKIFRDKELKGIPKLTDGTIDVNQLLESVKAKAKAQIKLIFGVTRKDIGTSLTLLEEQLSVDSGNAESTIASCSKLPLVLLKSNSLQNFKYHGIYINGLYKFIKIISGIQNEGLASALSYFFNEDNQDNRQVMHAFFANEKTQLYCRNSSMLVQILSLLVKNDKRCNAICDQFVVKLITETSITSIDDLRTEPRDNSVIPLFKEFFESALDIALQFKHILSVAKINIATREHKINKLNSSQDVYLKSAFYFCFISPLLERINASLKFHGTWMDLDLHALRLELSLAFHVLLGMNPTAPRTNGMAKAPVFLDLVVDNDMQEKVKLIFAAIGASDIGHQSRVKPKHIVLADESEQTEQQNRRLDKERDVPRRSRKASESSVVKGPKPLEDLGSINRGIYSSSRTMSFYSPVQNSIASSSSSSSSKTPTVETSSRNRSQSSTKENKTVERRASHAVISRLPLISTSQKEPSLEDYFNELFSCDLEKATQFVLSLVKPKDKRKFTWGVRVLNEACDKSNKQIAALLMTHLSETEFLAVFTELLKEETDQSWCRGNKLLSQLIQQLLAHEDCKEFKKKVWGTVLTLSDSFSKIKVKQRESMVLTPDSFDAEQVDIKTVQNNFFSVVRTILSPKEFPILIQKVLTLSYADLMRREEGQSSTDDSQLRKLLALILLRFINPIIYEEAQLLTDTNMKMWYLKILPAAIQSLASPISLRSLMDDEPQSLQDMIFVPVTKDDRKRKKIGQMIATALNLGSIVAVPKDTASNNKNALDVSECIKELNDLLKQEQFSGLSFKPNGNVTPRREVQKPLVQTFFASSSDSDTDTSSNGYSSENPGMS